MDYHIIYDWNKLEEVDFKVYSGEPKIVLKPIQENGERGNQSQGSDFNLLE